LLKVGNPYLRPQFTKALEAAYNHDWSNGSIYLAAFHRIIEAQFLRIYSEDTTSTSNIINRIYQNTGRATNTGVEMILTQQILKSWDISKSFNYYNIDIEDHSGTLLFPYVRSYFLPGSRGNTWDIKINNQFEIKNGLLIQLSCLYYAPKNIPQGEEFARSSIDLGISKEVLNSKGEITFSFTDIFNRFGIKQEFAGENFTGKYENYYETQILRVGFKYKY
jgi:hypothetical protein